MRIVAGSDMLHPFRFSPRSFVRRWRAECCGDVLFSSGDGPFWGVIGPVDRILDDPSALGPERVRAFLPPRRPGGWTRTEGVATLLGALVRRTATAQINGRWRDDPLAVDGHYPEWRLATNEERASVPLP